MSIEGPKVGTSYCYDNERVLILLRYSLRLYLFTGLKSETELC